MRDRHRYAESHGGISAPDPIVFQDQQDLLLRTGSCWLSQEMAVELPKNQGLAMFSHTGWWLEPLWKILVNWDDHSQYMGKWNWCSKPPTSINHVVKSMWNPWKDDCGYLIKLLGDEKVTSCWQWLLQAAKPFSSIVVIFSCKWTNSKWWSNKDLLGTKNDQMKCFNIHILLASGAASNPTTCRTSFETPLSLGRIWWKFPTWRKRVAHVDPRSQTQTLVS